jgi:hypothetical protein
VGTGFIPLQRVFGTGAPMSAFPRWSVGTREGLQRFHVLKILNIMVDVKKIINLMK